MTDKTDSLAFFNGKADALEHLSELILVPFAEKQSLLELSAFIEVDLEVLGYIIYFDSCFIPSHYYNSSAKCFWSLLKTRQPISRKNIPRAVAESSDERSGKVLS